MRDKSKKTKEPYYIVPMHIFDLADLNGDQKFLLAHIYSFGQKGCWQSNETLAKIFHTSPYSISRWISKIKKYIHVKCPKGYYRTLWAKTHPDVVELTKSHSITNANQKYSQKNIGNIAEEHKQIYEGDYVKPAIPPEQKCVTTNNITNKDTKRATIDRPAPLPAVGQSSAALEYRKQAKLESIENFKQKFGLGNKKRFTPISEMDFQNEKQRQRQALLALNK